MAQYIGSSNTENGKEIEVDSQDNVILAGQQSGGFDNSSISHIEGNGYYQAAQVLGNEEVWIMKTDNNGIVQWSTYYGDWPADELLALSVDNNDNIIFGGFTRGTGNAIDTDLPAPEFNPVNTFVQAENQSGGTLVFEGYITMMDPEGELIWFTYFGGHNAEVIRASTVSANDKYYICGYTTTINNDLEPGELPFPVEEFDQFSFSDWFQNPSIVEGPILFGFSARFDISPAIITSVADEINEQDLGGLSLFPNPAQDQITIFIPKETEGIHVYDVSGRLIFSRINTDTEFIQLDISTWENGLYLVQSLSNGNIETGRFIKQ